VTSIIMNQTIHIRPS